MIMDLITKQLERQTLDSNKLSLPKEAIDSKKQNGRNTELKSPSSNWKNDGLPLEEQENISPHLLLPIPMGCTAVTLQRDVHSIYTSHTNMDDPSNDSSNLVETSQLNFSSDNSCDSVFFDKHSRNSELQSCDDDCNDYSSEDELACIDNNTTDQEDKSTDLVILPTITDKPFFPLSHAASLILTPIESSPLSRLTSSSDEEVIDLLSYPQPLMFSSSPPRGVLKFSKTVSPRRFLSNVTANYENTVYPQRRYRHIMDGNNSLEINSRQRSFLDFEKMRRSSEENNYLNNERYGQSMMKDFASNT